MMDTESPLTNIPAEGSLGLLAYGYQGIVAWRAARGSAWIEDRREAMVALALKDESAEKDDAPHSKAPTTKPDPSLRTITVTIVSGLPRSGTSMLMQMLVAGGMSAFTDTEREADPSNPRGYFEHEDVKALARDSEWVKDADGSVVKVVSPLLPHLPAGPTYKILLLSRNIEEILQSQAAMLDELGKDAAAADVLRHHYAQAQGRARAWIRRTPDATGLGVVHRDVVSDPVGQARLIADFLDLDLDPEAMAAAVDPSLYRQRTDRLATPDA